MTTPAQPAAAGKKKFPSMSSPTTWLVILGIALAGGAYLLYRSKQNAANNNSNSGTSGSGTDTTDYSGEIATLQAEVADLQSSFSQDESGESGTSGSSGSGGTTPAKLTAPTGLSVTPKVLAADFGWGKVDGAGAYELEVTGAGGKGTGTSHYDHAGTGNHAEGVKLAKGNYKARVRAGTSTANIHGPWTAYKSFTVPGASTPGKGPPHIPAPKEPED